MIRQTVQMGAVTLLICENESGIPSLVVVPQGMEAQVTSDKVCGKVSFAQVYKRHDSHSMPFARGLTMLQSESAVAMRIQSITESENGIVITAREPGGIAYTTELTRMGRALKVSSRIRNVSDVPVTVDNAPTFCFSGMTPFAEGFAPDTMKLHRFTTFWSSEARHIENTIEELNLEPSWARSHPRNVRFGQYGSMPLRSFAPVMALEDTVCGVTWGVSLAWGGSWNMEVLRQFDDVVLAGGLAGWDDGHFRKTLAPGETLLLPDAAVTSVRGGYEAACEALLDVQKAQLVTNTEAERTLGILYNEYCDTWGKPTRETVAAELEQAKKLGLSYFVIDAGWYGQLENWEVSIGDWFVRKSAFPDGMKPVTEQIRAAGLIPGVWFEAENASYYSDVFREHPELFTADDGVPIRECERVFLNLTRADARAYVQKNVIDFLKENGFGYMKNDYNNTYGLGFDGFESEGEANLSATLAAYGMFDAIHEQLPDLVLENCSSGGHRLVGDFMKRCQMASFSDAHECPYIPLIAADLHCIILPQQSQIWAVLRSEQTNRRIIWLLASTLLGRMCLSGPIDGLNESQLAAVRKGVHFYKASAPIIADGETRVYRRDITNYDHAHGWQVAVRHGDNGQVLVLANAFEKNGGSLTLSECDFSGMHIVDSYMDADCACTLAGGKLTFTVGGEYCAVAVRLAKN